jgi:hypothetical protein
MVQIRGHFDGVVGSRAFGWVADLDAPDEVLSVEFFASAPDRGLTKLDRIRANRPRRDLQEAGFTSIDHGFEWRIPFSAQGFVLSARVAGSGMELPGSPTSIEPSRVYEGALESVAEGVARGWAWAWDPTVDVAVDIFVDAKHRDTVSARMERPDLALGRIGDGRHGFAWRVPDEFADGRPHEFACRITGTSAWLQGSPLTTIVDRSTHSTGLAVAGPVRRYARRPLFGAALPTEDLLRGDEGGRPEYDAGAANHSFGNVAAAEALRAAEGQFWPPLRGVLHRPDRSTAPIRTGPRRVRLLIPVWGDDYIGRFCRFSLPTLLAPNNLPYLLARHQVEVVFLTRNKERCYFYEYPSFGALFDLARTSFIDIDDIFDRYFESSGLYATVLTFAFFRGVRASGEAARDTEFIFWNADFLAADGTFRTLTELISAGVRCTLAPSLRIDTAIEAELAARVSDGTVLDIAPCEWVALASRFPHPSVLAQTVNRSEIRMIDSFRQLYWQINDSLMVGRVFLMFMLHIRPEQLCDELYGHCDYTFIPEMVPSGSYHFETSSDRLLILELQASNRDGDDIIPRDRRITPHEVAAGLSRWTSREHQLASRQLAVFNSGPVMVDLDQVRQMTDRFMDAVYRRLPEPIWHNGHRHWIDSLNASGIDYRDPGPDRPRSHLAAALRWTEYDLDILRESWPDPTGAPDDIFGLELPLPPTFDVSGWLAAAHARYCRAWLGLAADHAGDDLRFDLISGHFHGFGWGLARRGTEGWSRRPGPDGRAVVLVKVAPTSGVRVSVGIASAAAADLDTLEVYVNGRTPGKALASRRAGGASIHFDVGDGCSFCSVRAAQPRIRVTPPTSRSSRSRFGRERRRVLPLSRHNPTARNRDGGHRTPRHFSRSPRSNFGAMAAAAHHLAPASQAW